MADAAPLGRAAPPGLLGARNAGQARPGEHHRPSRSGRGGGRAERARRPRHIRDSPAADERRADQRAPAGPRRGLRLHDRPLRHVAEPGALPALVHCTAGKDRTGVLVALTLAALGVPDHLIADDYALSRGYLYGLTEGGRARIDTAGLPERFAPELLAAPPQLILAVLERARGQVGSIPGYLLAHGLREQELAALREALVERRAPLSPCETRAFG